LTISNKFWLARAYLILELQGDILISTQPLTVLPIVLSRIRDLTEEHSAVFHPGTSVCLLGFIQRYYLIFLKAEDVSDISN